MSIETSSSIELDLRLLFPVRLARRWGILPLERRADGAVAVAITETSDEAALDNLQTLIGVSVAPILFPEKQFAKALEDRYGVGADALETEDGAMARFVNDLIRQAHAARATDIHIEPFDDDLLIRFRVDGILQPTPLPVDLQKFQLLLTSRIKVMADMNIAEKRLPQDGRIHFAVDGDEMDIRVSTIPVVNGESVDLRLLPRTRLSLGLEELGMAADHRSTMAELIRKPNGIVLVTGPTGHGKTTTLYACLSRLNTADKKIVTIEDPVEVRLRGVNQIQTHAKIGLSFANGLRAVLRQDPDVIMVGEIRDLETAEIAIRASLTGHQVFSTLHTNDSIGAVTRLMDMGIEPYLVASSIHAVLAQRLIRLVCSNCSGNKTRGCDSCHNTGFRGRTGIFELLLITDEIKALITDRAPRSAIRTAAQRVGMRSMFEDGRVKTKAGLTTIEEVLRVTEENP